VSTTRAPERSNPADEALGRGRLRGGRLLPLVGLLVTLGLVAVAARKIDPADVVEALRANDLRWLAPAFLAFCAATLFRALRWRSLFVRETRPGTRPVLASMLVGDLFNNVLPMRAGEAARLLALHARTGASRAQIGATVVLERLFDVAVLLLLLFVSLAWLPEVTWLRAAVWLALVAGGVAVGAIVALAIFGDRPLRLLLRPFRRVPFLPLDRLEQAPANATRGLAGLTDARVAGGALAFTVGAWTFGILAAWLLSLGFALEVSPLAILLVVVATALGMAVPSAPASIGVFEAATVVALAAYDVPAAQALSYALVLHALGFLPLVAGGLLVLLHGRRSRARRGSGRA
jgi:glycosyltransferase 2 family protein